jgi:lysophospholipase L1-like esterase
MAVICGWRAAVVSLMRMLWAAGCGATRRLAGGPLGALGVILLLGLLAMGCGGSNTDNAAQAGRTPSQTATPASPARTWKLVAIGDSLPYGGQDCGCEPFPELYGKAIARRTGVAVNTANLSEHNGLTSAGLRREILTSPELRRAVAGADIITVTIGHNDTPWNRADDDCDGNNRLPPRDWEAYDSACVRRTAREYGRNLDRVLGEIVALRNGRPAALRVTDDYNDVIGDPHLHAATVPAALRSTRGVLDAYSALTCQIARRHHAVCIDTYHKFNGARGVRDAGALLAADHTHPNSQGHVVIARLLTRSGVTPLHR